MQPSISRSWALIVLWEGTEPGEGRPQWLRLVPVPSSWEGGCTDPEEGIWADPTAPMAWAGFLTNFLLEKER